jgi:hypothetical protein
MNNDRFLRGELSTGFLAEEYPDNEYICVSDDLARSAAVAAALDKFTSERRVVGLTMSPEAPGSQWLQSHRRANLRRFGRNH